MPDTTSMRYFCIMLIASQYNARACRRAGFPARGGIVGGNNNGGYSGTMQWYCRLRILASTTRFNGV